MPKPLTIPAKLDRFPPVVVRLLARVKKPGGAGVRALTDAEIARAGGLSLEMVRHISKLTEWSDVSIDTLLSFLKGCGADLDNRDWLRKNAAYMASINGAPRYLRQSPDWTGTYEPLIRILLRHEQGKAA